MERKELSENLQWCLCNPTPNEVWPMTTIVYGPCGSGKRTAVRNILKDQEAVIHLKLQHFEDDPRKEIVNSILRQVSPSSLCKPSLKDDYEKCRALESALESMRNKNPRVVPTFFIEAPFYGHDCVLELLQLLTQWVNKRRLVNAVVVLSPDNEIGDALVHHDMRAHVVKIDHLTMDETKDYLLGICKQKELTGSQEEREQLAKELAPIIGNRLWDLQDLANVIPKGGTLHDLKMLTHKQAEDLERIFENALWWNLAFFMKNDVKIDEFNMVLQKLLTDKGAHLYEFLKFYNYHKEKSNKRSHQKIWDEIADERANCEGVLSCVFYVDPTSLKVTVRNPFTRKALEKRLKKMP